MPCPVVSQLPDRSSPPIAAHGDFQQIFRRQADLSSKDGRDTVEVPRAWARGDLDFHALMARLPEKRKEWNPRLFPLMAIEAGSIRPALQRASASFHLHP